MRSWIALNPQNKDVIFLTEGLGRGYVEKRITVIDLDGGTHPVFMYAAEGGHIDPTLRSYSWYRRLVVEGARQHALPPDYIARIEAVPATEDPDGGRDAANRRIVC